ncbi:MAG: DUF2272 domain-containing protein [Microvirga sp.]
MDKLMRFNPEPFDAETFVRFETEEIFEPEDELKMRRGGGGHGRSTPAWSPRPTFRTNVPKIPRTRFAGNAGSLAPKLARTSAKHAAPNPGKNYPYLSRRWRGGYPVNFYGPGYSSPEMTPAADLAVPPAEHVRWVQGCLNGFLGLRLPVDGIMNAATRSGVRAFQERRGLPITGLVGPETEAALRDACRDAGSAGSSPPAVLPPAEPPSPALPGGAAPPPAGDGVQESEFELAPLRPPARMRTASATPSIKTLRQNIVRIANEQLARWDNGRLKEADPRAFPILQDYWKAGPGLSFTRAELASAAFQSSHPWSAAFISWVMREAEAGAAFKYASSHSVYISAAKANRLADNANPFKAYRLSEIVPRAGDLICRNRANSGATYDTIRPGMKTHCDIVVAVLPGALTVVGGNVSNSVSSRKVRTDATGRVTESGVFAVIRVGLRKPHPPGTPLPSPSVPPGQAPAPSSARMSKLLKQDRSVSGVTLYPEIDLGIVDKFGQRAAPMTGIFLPDGFVAGSSIDLILYLHGFKAARALTIDGYWDAKRYPYGALREKLNTARRNVVLVAPTLGAHSEAGRLVEPGGLDAYLSKVLAVIGAHSPSGRKVPTLRNLILACHSGGGLPMRRLAGGRGRAIASLRECWGFDCTYNGGDDTFWAGWASKTPSARCYFYYIPGSQTARLSERLRDMHVANAVVRPAKDGRHNYVPVTHWLERIQGARFLAALAGGAALSGGSTPSSTVPPTPSEEPADLRSLTHQQFIEFVGKHARQAMAATGVPASVTVAQAILETGWGKHTIGSAKNLFGIKGKGPAGSVRVPTREFVNGAWMTINADFAKYDSFAQSVIEHARFFLRHKRYAAALNVRNDANRFAREIHKAGYATGPNYATELIKLMTTHNLYRFDH